MRRALLPAPYEATTWALVATGFGAAVLSAVSDPPRAWAALLVHACFVLWVAVSSLLFIAVHYLSSARWSAGLRRIAEALMAALPAGAVLLVVVLAVHEAPAREGLSGAAAVYRSTPFVLARAAAILGAWTLVAALVRRASLLQDAGDPERQHRRLKGLSAAFVALFAVSFSIASFDWLLALNPHWVSTIFPWYLIGGLLALGVAAVALTASALRLAGVGAFLAPSQLHDLGTLLFAYCTFWAYLWFSQYLLIWYANIPEEVTHYVVRTGDRWITLFVVNVILNWILPFALLLPKAAKRNAWILLAASAAVLGGRWLDLYLIVVPEVEAAPAFGVLDAAMALGVVALLVVVTVRALGAAPLAPVNDPVPAGSPER